MNVAVRKPDPITVDAFLKRIDAAPHNERWQLIGGEIVRLMAGGTRRHAAIAMNIGVALSAAARRHGYSALPDIFVRNPAIDDTVVAPDVLVECGHQDGGSRTVEEPVVVVEVLSPSTMVFDRGAKLAFYQSLPSLRSIVLVYQDEVRVEVWSRPAREAGDAADGFAAEPGDPADAPPWHYAVLRDAADHVDLPVLEATLDLAAIYDRVDLPGAA